VSFPPHLLDELARLFARAALDRFVHESEARTPHPTEDASTQPESQSDYGQPTDGAIDANSDQR